MPKINIAQKYNRLMTQNPPKREEIDSEEPSLTIKYVTKTPDSCTFVATSNKITSTPLCTNRMQKFDTLLPEQEDGRQIIQSSKASSKVIRASMGLTSSIVDAYNTHHDLILRPDDVWQAILTQFSFYVSRHGEALRDKFVDFQGKKELTIVSGGTLFTCDFGSFAQRMVDEQISKNIKDPEVTEWLLPNFSTTFENDRIVASVSIMSTLQNYFSYGLCLSCGIPKVTLLGTVEDWKLLRRKIDRLPQYEVSGNEEGPIMQKWHKLLQQVLDEFVHSANGQCDLQFWDTVCSHEGGGSGPSYLSGWVTVFSCFRKDGKWQGDDTNSKKWPRIDTDDIPSGIVSVPVKIDDNGTKYDAVMMSGQWCYEVAGKGMDTIRSRSDWCIAVKGKTFSLRRNHLVLKAMTRTRIFSRVGHRRY